MSKDSCETLNERDPYRSVPERRKEYYSRLDNEIRFFLFLFLLVKLFKVDRTFDMEVS